MLSLRQQSEWIISYLEESNVVVCARGKLSLIVITIMTIMTMTCGFPTLSTIQ